MQRDREELNVHVLADFFIFYFFCASGFAAHKP